MPYNYFKRYSLAQLNYLSIQLVKMMAKLGYVIFGGAIGAGIQYAYRKYKPKSNGLSMSSHSLIQSYIAGHNLEQGYLINILNATGVMLKGFYSYGMTIKLQGFNFNSTYLLKQEVDNNMQIKHLRCIFSPNEYLCGHPQIQHGGATATLIDQNFGYLASLNARNTIATVELNIKYKRPVKKDQLYVFEAEVVKKQNKKIWLSGKIRELETGQVKVQTNAIFYVVNWDNQMSRVFAQLYKYLDYTKPQPHPAPEIPSTSTPPDPSISHENKVV